MKKDWQINAKEFAKKIDSWEYILIDLRTPEEVKEFWYIPKTDKFCNIYETDITEKINALDKNKKYLLYCFHWSRSEWIYNSMKLAWFTSVYFLKWWIDDWKNLWYKIIN